LFPLVRRFIWPNALAGFTGPTDLEWCDTLEKKADNVGREKTTNDSEFIAVGVIVLTMLLLGAWQHLQFSLRVGELAWFKNAYDEDTYILLANGLSAPRLDRFLSDGIARLFLSTLGGSPAAALVAFDLVFPPLIFLAAYFVASRLFKNLGPRILFSLLLMFGGDLFSLGNSASYMTSIVSLQDFKAVIDLFGQNLVPPIETSYLNIVRSPEPQVVYVVGFLFAGLLIEIVRSGGRGIRPAIWLVFAATQFLLTLSYSFVSLPLLMVEAFAVFVLLARRSFRAAALLAVLCALSIAAMAIAYAGVDAEGSRFFASRLPSISTAVLGACVVLGVAVVQLWKRGFADRVLWLVVGFAGLPIALMNQQLLTGVMISTRDWERYINHPAMMIGLGILLSRLETVEGGTMLKRAHRWAAPLAAALSLIIALSLNQSTSFWHAPNARTLAMTKAIEAAPNELDGWTLVLEEPGLAPSLAVRRGGRRDALIDYTDVVLDWIPSSEHAEFRLTRHGEALFEYWRLLGLSNTEAANILQTEVDARGGYYSAFFFNICDYWYPCTDNRAVRTDEITALLPEVIASYERYRGQPPERLGGRRYAFVTTGTTATRLNEEIFDPAPVSRVVIDGETVSIHLQKRGADN
jgi:hypothetical protein